MKPTKPTPKNTLKSTDITDIDPDLIQAPALKNALAQMKKEQDERDAQKALAVLQRAQKNIDDAVRVVRQVRAQERKAMARLKAMENAMTNFMKTGNIAEYNNAVSNAPS